LAEKPVGYRDILVHVDSTKPGNVRLALAIALAKRFGARLTGIHIVATPNVPPVYKPSAAELVAAGYAEAARKAAEQSEALFRDRVRNLALATDYVKAEGDIAEHLRQASRFVDLIMVGQADTENPPGIEPFLLPERVIFGCAAPVLVVPNRFVAEAIGRSVLVGWDGSGQAACKEPS
jgi:nucleotide-binding universal stress UspA family protein